VFVPTYLQKEAKRNVFRKTPFLLNQLICLRHAAKQELAPYTSL
jgi:hypothetical protein